MTAERLKITLAWALLGLFLFLGFAAVMDWTGIIDWVGRWLVGIDIVMSPMGIAGAIGLGWWSRGKTDARRNRR